MRRLVIACSLITATTFLLVSCRSGKKTDMPAAPAAQVGISNMTRVQMDCGVSYEVLQEGTGATPSVGNKVTVHYTGWLDNNGQLGTQFDSSHKRSQPFTFQLGVGMVIKGWDEGVKTMKVGEKRRIYIPWQLGYGSRGAGAVIPPYANLIFDVELLGISA
ncbi:MAG TPA: FKBP-type peptidyl-prolyl cis-trans isomerase [Candidatus Babeliales bacterium]|nr:FKBP-type peptidyl-prolyl cis-trans isomerase [Candidatus Babeliales bacterium]